MKSSVKTKQLRIRSFLESMRGLINRTRFLSKQNKKRVSKIESAPCYDLDSFPQLRSTSFPIRLKVSLSYDDDPLVVLKHIKIDYALLEVNESTIMIDVELFNHVQQSTLLKNLNSLLKQSYAIEVEETSHVDY